MIQVQVSGTASTRFAADDEIQKGLLVCGKGLLNVWEGTRRTSERSVACLLRQAFLRCAISNATAAPTPRAPPTVHV